METLTTIAVIKNLITSLAYKLGKQVSLLRETIIRYNLLNLGNRCRYVPGGEKNSSPRNHNDQGHKHNSSKTFHYNIFLPKYAANYDYTNRFYNSPGAIGKDYDSYELWQLLGKSEKLYSNHLFAFNC